MNSKIDGMPRVENPHLRLLCRWLALVGFSLAKIRHESGCLPHRIRETPIDLRWMLHAYGFGDRVAPSLNSRRSSTVSRLGRNAAWHSQSHEKDRATQAETRRLGECVRHGIRAGLRFSRRVAPRQILRTAASQRVQ